MRFTATTKHTVGGLGGAVAGTGIGFIRGNGVGFGGRNGVGFAGEVGVGFVGMGSVGVGSVAGVGFGGDNSVGSGTEIDVDGNPGDAVVCLGALLATAIGPASFRFNVAAFTSPTADRGYPTPASSMV